MALITCPECGSAVSDNAKVCPHCGRALKSSPAIPVLLGISCLLAILVIAFFLPSYLNPETVSQATEFHIPYLISLIIGSISLVSAILGFVNMKCKRRALAIVSIVCSIVCFALLAYGFTLTTQFFLLVPFILGAAVLTLVASCLSLKTLQLQQQAAKAFSAERQRETGVNRNDEGIRNPPELWMPRIHSDRLERAPI